MLINCAAYQGGKKLADVEVPRIGEYIGRPDTFIWVAMRDVEPHEMTELQRQFGLHELAVEDALRGHQRPKIEEYGEVVFTVIHLIDFHGQELAVGEAAIFVGHNFVLSVRTRSRQNFGGVRERCEREPIHLKQGPGFVFYALLDSVVDHYFPVLEALENELDAIEDAMFAKESPRRNIERLYALKRKIAVLKHAVAPMMEAVGKLHGGRVPKVCANMQDYFRDVYDHLIRVNATVDSIRDTIVTAIQVNLAMVTIEETDVSKRLAAWAGIFAVATAFAGIWGMNFEVMPELKWEWGYPAALGAIALTCGLLYWRFKKAGWL
ncbi:MAG: magnesium and cobalt transport protein CorA [Alphaproteobacteria bacterium]|nr:magnesium and cobalt transport protein CorA [Alphaproteobacteria bacterium]